MQCNAMQCNAMQCNAMQYNAMQWIISSLCDTKQHLRVPTADLFSIGDGYVAILGFPYNNFQKACDFHGISKKSCFGKFPHLLQYKVKI
jgi:hypothetical protein